MTTSSASPCRITDEGSLHKYRTEIPNTIVRGRHSRTLSVYAKWLYTVIKSRAGDEGQCWQSTSKLAEDAQFSRSMVSRAKRELARAGLIEFTAKGNHQSHESDCIRIVDIWPDNMAEFATTRCAEKTHATPAVMPEAVSIGNSKDTLSYFPGKQLGDVITDEKSTTYAEAVSIGNSWDTLGCFCGSTQEDPKEDLKINLCASTPILPPVFAPDLPLLPTAADTEKAAPQYSPAFLRFWAAYPVKKGKGQAWVCWQRLGLDPLADQICRSITEHASQDADWRKGFVKHPSTFLNGRCWEDEFASTPLPTSHPTRRGLVL